MPSRQPCTTQPPNGERRALAGRRGAGSRRRSRAANAATSSCVKRSSAGGSTVPRPCTRRRAASASRRSAPRAARRRGGGRRSGVSSACTSRICASESQPSTVPGPSSSAMLDVPAEDVLEHVAGSAVERLCARSWLVARCRRSRSARSRRDRTPSAAGPSTCAKPSLRVEVGDERVARARHVGPAQPREARGERAARRRARADALSAVRPITRQLSSSVSITSASGRPRPRAPRSPSPTRPWRAKRSSSSSVRQIAAGSRGEPLDLLGRASARASG